MSDFFKEYWLWILVPFAVVLGAIAVLYFLADGSGSGDFVYNIF